MDTTTGRTAHRVDAKDAQVGDILVYAMAATFDMDEEGRLYVATEVANFTAVLANQPSKAIGKVALTVRRTRHGLWQRRPSARALTIHRPTGEKVWVLRPAA